MTAPIATGFDLVAPEYTQLWSGTPAGRFQRESVWRHAAALFPAGSRILDLGCGTGDDALMFTARGVCVTGIDASPEMVRIARNRGVDARAGAIEQLGQLEKPFDGVWSNFGALNCVERVTDLRTALARTVRPGGYLVVCLMSRICLWEICWYAMHGRLRKAARRWNGKATSSLAECVFYPTAREIRHAFAPEFHLESCRGIGVAVPPSYVTGLSSQAMNRLNALDNRIASIPIFRSIGDHHLMIFRRGAR